MTIREAADIIKDRVSARDVAALYGYKANSGAYIGCPFHGEKTPSLKLHKSGWYCYGCGAGGSVVDFVMMHDGCTFPMAVKALDDRFCLGLIDNGKRTLTSLLSERKARQDFDREKAELVQAVQELIEDAEAELRMWWQVYNDALSTPKAVRTAKQWFDIENAREWCQYYEMQVNDLRESIQEVKAWRMSPSRAHSA